MKYILRKDVLAGAPIVDLSRTEFESIRNARTILKYALAMEEKYDLVVLNYIDFEQSLLDWAVLSMVKGKDTYETFFRMRADLSNRIANLLAASRTYEDHMPQLARHVLSAYPKAKGEVGLLVEKEEDQCAEYRFVRELRNFVQHFGFAVHFTSLPRAWDGFGKMDNLLFSVEVRSYRAELQKHRELKKLLGQMPEEIDLKEVIRKYIEAISRVHNNARKLVEEAASQARSIIKNTLDRYKEQLSDEVVGLYAYCMSDEDEEREKIPVILEWDNFRLQLIEDNKLLVNLSKRYVSSKLQPIS